MPNFRKLKLSSRSFGLIEKTTPRKSWSESTPSEIYLKIGRIDFWKKKRRRMSGNSAIMALDGQRKRKSLEEVVSYSWKARSQGGELLRGGCKWLRRYNRLQCTVGSVPQYYPVGSGPWTRNYPWSLVEVGLEWRHFADSPSSKSSNFEFGLLWPRRHVHRTLRGSWRACAAAGTCWESLAQLRHDIPR